jgi:hypothetical protein
MADLTAQASFDRTPPVVQTKMKEKTCWRPDPAVLSQSLIGLRAAMSLALPARQCYQSLRDCCHQTILDLISYSYVLLAIIVGCKAIAGY